VIVTVSVENGPMSSAALLDTSTVLLPSVALRYPSGTTMTTDVRASLWGREVGTVEEITPVVNGNDGAGKRKPGDRGGGQGGPGNTHPPAVPSRAQHHWVEGVRWFGHGVIKADAPGRGLWAQSSSACVPVVGAIAEGEGSHTRSRWRSSRAREKCPWPCKSPHERRLTPGDHAPPGATVRRASTLPG
jgi:hypothetical protein